ncbi:MAG: tetratricopeptide repeat protein [Flavihumibacter sp.]|nr:tetratricopeptide repeat protein [Flavihumibacter sp.]
MSENKHTEQPVAVAGFWKDNAKKIAIALGAIIVLVGGYLGYKYWISEPNEKKAAEAMFKAEEYYRLDSLNLALNGDAQNAGFLKVISKYSGTRAANLANFYAGSSYLKQGDFKNAVKYLESFSTNAPQVKARATALLADAYAEQGNKEKAVSLYAEAGKIFDADDYNSPEYLFRAGYLYESMGKTKEAIEMYQLIKEKYPKSERGFDIDKYLGRLGAVE